MREDQRDGTDQDEYIRLLQEKNQILKEQLDRALREKLELHKRIQVAEKLNEVGLHIFFLFLIE